MEAPEPEGEQRRGGGGAGRLGREPAHARQVGCGQHEPGEQQAGDAERELEPEAAQHPPRLRHDLAAQLERPEGELPRRQQPGGDDRGPAVQRRLVEDELQGVAAADEREPGCGARRRAERERGAQGGEARSAGRGDERRPVAVGEQRRPGRQPGGEGRGCERGR